MKPIEFGSNDHDGFMCDARCHRTTARARAAVATTANHLTGIAQYCIGDSWKFRLSSGVPNTSVRLLGTSNGQILGNTRLG